MVTTEGERSRYFANNITEGHWKKLVTQPMNMIGMVEITDIKHPSLISVFPYPEENWFDNEEGNLVPGAKVAITEDVLVDDRGYIYLDTFMDGLYIVRCTV